MYNEVEFWNWNKTPIPKKELEDKEIQMVSDFINKEIKNCKKILDFGSGKGRLLHNFVNIEHVECYDISNKWENDVRQISNNLKLKNFKYTIEKTIKKLPYENNEFDAVVCSLVLLHQRPNNIMNVMEELCRIGKKIIVITHQNREKDFINPTKEEIETGKKKKFNYNYIQICKDNNWSYNEYLYRTERISHLYFTYGKL